MHACLVVQVWGTPLVWGQVPCLSPSGFSSWTSLYLSLAGFSLPSFTHQSLVISFFLVEEEILLLSSFQWVLCSNSRTGSNMASDVQLAKSLPENPSTLSPNKHQSSMDSDTGVAAKCILINAILASLNNKLKKLKLVYEHSLIHVSSDK